jgi:hypothetical protein
VLVGWYADVSSLTTVLPGYVPMRPNTAVALVALGIAVALLDRKRLAIPLRWPSLSWAVRLSSRTC